MQYVYENKRYRVHQEIEDYTTAKICCKSVPLCSIYGIFTYIWPKYMPKTWFSKKWVPPITSLPLEKKTAVRVPWIRHGYVTCHHTSLKTLKNKAPRAKTLSWTFEVQIRENQDLTEKDSPPYFQHLAREKIHHPHWTKPLQKAGYLIIPSGKLT